MSAAVRLVDLSPADRRAILAGRARPALARAGTPARVDRGGRAGSRWCCHVCGDVFTAWDGVAGAQTHSNTTRHARLELVLTERESEP
jgi:hypothetical protein